MGCASWRDLRRRRGRGPRARGARAALAGDGHSWPWVTFGVNLAGTALLAYVIARLSHRPYARPLIGIGLCGALTTFSTLQLEALELADNGHAPLGATYVLTSIAAGHARRPGRAAPAAGGESRDASRSVDRRRAGQRGRGGAAIPVHTAVQRRTRRRLPFGTLAVNVLGSLALGRPARRGGDGRFAAARGHGAARVVHDVLDLDARDGRLREDGEPGLAFVNVAGSLAVGLAAVGLGWALGAAF